MATLFDEQPDLDLVSSYLAVHNLTAERFSAAETRAGKTPDFRVTQGGAVVAYCEVKSPNDPWLDTLLDNAPPDTIVGGVRSDPTFNRISRLLLKADEQFQAVNPTRDAINILAYVSHDDKSHYGDLLETLTGYFHADDGTRHPTMLHFAEGRLAKPKSRIDTFLWFDGEEGQMIGAVINQSDAARVQRLCNLLGFDLRKVRAG
jgi:hypothetical protein